MRPRVLELALAEADRRGLAMPDDVRAVLARRPRTWGARRLQHLMGRPGGAAFTRSEAERRFLALIREGQLPAPEVNTRIGGVEVDFLWRSEGVVADVDGFAYHSSRSTFEQDRRRDARLGTLGLRTVRVTWRQLSTNPTRSWS